MNFYDILLAKKLSGGGGGDITTEALNVTANGQYTAPQGKAYTPVNVDIKGYKVGEVDVPTDIASFTASDAPLKSLTASIVPVQAGSGDPSPSNVRPITGWTEVNVQRDGVNIFPLYTPNSVTSNGVTATLNTDGSITFSGTATSNASFSIKNNGSLNTNPYASDTKVLDLDADSYYTISKYNDSGKLRIMVLAAETPAQSVIVDFINENSGCFKGHSSYKFIMRVNSGTTINETIKLQLEKGSTATTYEPYAGTTTTIPFTDGQGQSVEVFGGSVDVINGVVTPCPYYASYNGEQLTGEWISDRDVYSPNTTPTIGAQVVNIGATGTPFSVQPTSIKSLDGENNVWASTGDVEELKYFEEL